MKVLEINAFRAGIKWDRKQQKLFDASGNEVQYETWEKSMANKYNWLSRVAVEDVVYDSHAEYRQYQNLKLLERAGQIEALHYHGIRFSLGKSDKGKLISYTPNFTYIKDGRLVAHEVKGFRVRDWPVRADLFAKAYPEWQLEVTK